MSKRFLVAAFAIAIAAAAAAQRQPAPNPFRYADQVIEQAIERKDIPGAVLVVGHDGMVVYRKAYGKRSLEPTVEPMTLDTVFDAASLTKVVATTPCLMKLLGEGKFRLNDPIAKYIPEFGANGKQEMTIRQMLTHYSGLREDLDLKEPWSGKETAVRLMAEERPIDPPGSRFRYSDINFEMLGMLAEKLSGKSLPECAAEAVYRPLGMKDSMFLPPELMRARIAPTEYDENGKMLRGVVHDPTARRMGGVAGHAGLFTTAGDLAKYAQALLDGKVLSPALIEKMTTPQTPPWATSVRGFGWDLDTPFASNRGELLPIGSYGHTGFTGTSLWVDPFTKTYIILMTNAVHPRLGGDSWGKISIRTRVANAVTEALHLKLDDGAARRLPAITGYNDANANMHRPMARNGKVLNGIDVLAAEDFKSLREGRTETRVGVLTNQTGLTIDGRRTIDVLAHAQGTKLTVIFSPEHGAQGEMDTTEVGNTVDKATGIPVVSVYGAKDAERRPSVESLKHLDAVVIDIQDVGARFYTYETTVGYFLEAAAKAGVEVFVLDRPNPVGGTMVQGPVSDVGESFVNYHPTPIRQGMTLGELAQMFNGERKLGAKLTVVRMQGWQRGDWFDSTGQVWVNPSPNMRNLEQATLYTGVAIFDSTNVSVGRGTDTPFQWIGAPWITQEGARGLADYLNARQISGVRFVPVEFTPRENKFAGERCGGVSMVITDRYVLDAPEMGVEIASAMLRLFKEFEPKNMLKLLGNQRAYEMITSGADPRRIAEEWQDGLDEFAKVREKYLIYK